MTAKQPASAADLAVLAELIASATDPADKGYLRRLAFEMAMPEQTAWGRAETDYCERGTDSCSVLHTYDSECQTW